MDKIIITFSGGRTSAFMLKYILDNYQNIPIKVVFANTGQEHSGTYEFIREVALNFCVEIIWVEALISPIVGEGIRHKIVNYETATRDGRLFHEISAKHGLLNKSRPHCTKYLKIYPIDSFIHNELGWKRGSYHRAIGIRADEIDRVNPKYQELKYWYPLAWNGITKKDVLDFWNNQKFDLKIGEHHGNCVWCYKKSFKKLISLVNEDKTFFNVPLELEKLYSRSSPIHKKNPEALEDKIFRSRTSTLELFKMAESSLEIDSDYMNQSNGCSESCEVDQQLEFSVDE